MFNIGNLIPFDVDKVTWDKVSNFPFTDGLNIPAISSQASSWRHVYPDLEPDARNIDEIFRDIMEKVNRNSKDASKILSRITFLIHTDLKVAALAAQCADLYLTSLSLRTSKFEGASKEDIARLLAASMDTVKVGWIASFMPATFSSAEEMNFFLRFSSLDADGYLKPINTENFSVQDIIDLKKFVDCGDASTSSTAKQMYEELITVRTMLLFHIQDDKIAELCRGLDVFKKNLLKNGIKQDLINKLIPVTGFHKKTTDESSLISLNVTVDQKEGEILNEYNKINFWLFQSLKNNLMLARDSHYFKRQKELFSLFYEQLTEVQKTSYHHLVDIQPQKDLEGGPSKKG